MNIVLWILQVALTIVNALHGWLYVAWSPASEERLRKRGLKPLDYTQPFARLSALKWG
jgi:hypothetical protein